MGWQELRDVCTPQIEADSESPDVAQFTNEASRAVLVLNIIPGAGVVSTPNLLGPIVSILGTAFRNPNRPTKMSRVLPVQHPMFGWTFATEITSIQGRGQRNGFRAVNRSAGAVGINWQAYFQYRAIVVFTSVKHAVKDDDATQQSELYRFVERYTQLGLENIIRPGNSFRWVTGTPNFPASIPVGVVARAQKGVMEYVWKCVPRIGLYGPDGLGFPSQIWDGVGKVNETTFDGIGPGKLLLLPPKFTTNATPHFLVDSAGGSTISHGTADMNLSYDVSFPMSYISPPLDPNFNYNIAPLWKRAGHCLFPPPPSQSTHFWYPATRTGANAAAALYEAYDFHKLFTLL